MGLKTLAFYRGLKAQAVDPRHFWSKANMLAAIHLWREEECRFPEGQELTATNGLPNYRVLKREFGSLGLMRVAYRDTYGEGWLVERSERPEPPLHPLGHCLGCSMELPPGRRQYAHFCDACATSADRDDGSWMNGLPVIIATTDVDELEFWI